MTKENINLQLFRNHYKAILILAVALGLMTWILGNAPEPQKDLKSAKIHKVPYVEVIQSSQAIPVISRGRVSASQIRQITSEVPGLVTYVSDKLIKGARVNKGDLLIQLDKQPFILDIAQKQTSLDQAKLQLLKTQAKARVARKGVGKTASEYARHIPQLRHANSQVNAAQVALIYAKNQLNKASIKAPINGKVINMNITEGEYIRATSSIAKIYGIDMVEVRLPLNDRQIDIVGINYDQQPNIIGPEFHPEVKLKSYQDHKNSWAGHITRTEGERDSNQLLYVIVQVPSLNHLNPTQKPLLPGSFIEANILGKVIRGLQIIPRKAEQANNKVWIINSDDRLTSKTVEVLYRGKELIYIKSGLSGNDRIATGSFHLMSEGLLVNPRGKESVKNIPLASTMECSHQLVSYNSPSIFNSANQNENIWL